MSTAADSAADDAHDGDRGLPTGSADHSPATPTGSGPVGATPPPLSRSAAPGDDAPTGPPRPPRTQSRARAPRSQSRQFDIGRALGTGFTIWGRNFVPFSMFGIVVFLPYAWIAYTAQHAPQLTPADIQAGNIAGYLVTAMILPVAVQTVLNALLSATLISGVFEQLRGRKPTFGSMLAIGASRTPAALGVALIQGLIWVGAWVPGGVAIWLQSFWIGIPLGLLGLVGGVVLMTATYVAAPVAVVERGGVFRAVARSFRLTKGYRLHVFLILFILVVAGGFVGGVLGGGLMVSVGESSMWIAQYVATALGGSLTAVFASVIYHDLRAVVDDADPAEIAAIFD